MVSSPSFMTFDQPVNFQPRPMGGAVDWWTIGGVYTPAQVVYAGNFKLGVNLAAAIANLTLGAGALLDPGGGATPTWAAGVGITGDGIGKYLGSNIIPGAGWSVFVQYSGASMVNASVLVGSDNFISARCALWPQVINMVNYFNGGGVLVAPALATGNLGVAGQQGYRNGIADGGALGAWVGGGVFPFYVLCDNWAGGRNAYTVATETALWIANITPTAPQVATLAASMAAL